jgi:hypothetical protein
LAASAQLNNQRSQRPADTQDIPFLGFELLGIALCLGHKIGRQRDAGQTACLLLQDLGQLAAHGFEVAQLIAHIPVQILKAQIGGFELLLQSLFLFGFERGSGKTAFVEPILEVVRLVQLKTGGLKAEIKGGN